MEKIEESRSKDGKYIIQKVTRSDGTVDFRITPINNPKESTTKPTGK